MNFKGPGLNQQGAYSVEIAEVLGTCKNAACMLWGSMMKTPLLMKRWIASSQLQSKGSLLC